jgi:hypothetical protein
MRFVKGASMADASYPVSEYIKAGTEAIVLIKTLYPLLPTQSRGEVEAKIYAAEEALQKANVFLAQAWGFQIHDCSFPPQIMLWNEELKERVCPGCGYKTNFNRPQPPGGGNTWASSRRG